MVSRTLFSSAATRYEHGRVYKNSSAKTEYWKRKANGQRPSGNDVLDSVRCEACKVTSSPESDFP